MTKRENTLRAIRFEQPDFIPMTFHINSACWHHYNQNALQDLMEEHLLLFPDFKRQKEVTPCYGLNSLVDDLIDGGVEVINLQDVVNGIDWIADKFAGRTCIDLDIDRQSITARGTPEQIDSLIREEVTKLGSKAGGLMMIYGLYPGVPLENVGSLMDAMERYSTHYL